MHLCLIINEIFNRQLYNKELVKTIIENKSKIDQLKKMFQGNKEVTEKLKNLKYQIQKK